MSMLRAVLLGIIAVALTGGNVVAASNNAGIGIIIGEPTGISGKVWTGNTTAIDAAAAWSFNDEDAFQLHGDYLIHNMRLIKVDQGTMALYFGLGGRVLFANDTFLGIRVPLGLDYIFESTPLDIFIELVPIMDLAPATELDLNAALGVRLFFGRTSY